MRGQSGEPGWSGWAAGSVAAPASLEPAGAEPAMVELAGLLARSRSGLSFVYQALDLVAARYNLRDAAVVIDSAAAGRQLFRLGRRPLRAGVAAAEQEWLSGVAVGPPGLHTDPPVVDRVTATYVAHLVEVALRVDLLDHDARHDPLTGLLNRRSYERTLDEAVGRSRRYGWPFALVLLDLDNFKSVNDRLGHAVGDAALRALGGELRAGLRTGDQAARLGGDEFALVILNASSPDVLTPLADRWRAALDRAVPDAEIRFSAGVACFPEDADDPLTLTRIADDRLYAAKASYHQGQWQPELP